MRKVYSKRQEGDKDKEDGGGGGWQGRRLLMLHVFRQIVYSQHLFLFFDRKRSLFLPSFRLSFRCYHCQYPRSHHTPVSSGATIANIFQHHHYQYLPAPQLPVSSGANIASILSIWLLYNYASLLFTMHVLPVCVDLILFLVFVGRF